MYLTLIIICTALIAPIFIYLGNFFLSLKQPISEEIKNKYDDL